MLCFVTNETNIVVLNVELAALSAGISISSDKVRSHRGEEIDSQIRHAGCVSALLPVRKGSFFMRALQH
jgi:hypothetical protein